jgi:glucose/arabinose dehydrogenase
MAISQLGKQRADLPFIPCVNLRTGGGVRSRWVRLFLGLLIAAGACAPPSALPPTATVPSSPGPVGRPTGTATTVALATAAPAPLPSLTTQSQAAESKTATPMAVPTDSAATPTVSSFPPAPASLTLIAEGLDRPVYLTQPADGSGRLFLVEQAGRVLIWRNGQFLSTPFIDLRDRVNANGNERGLLGLAFHPQYSINGRFFVYYTNAQGDLVIARYAVKTGNPDRADLASATTLLQIAHPFSNHNGGDLVFGPDGYLYIGIGDGGSQGDPNGNGQSLTTLLGKLLRIDVDADPYTVPPDNPFRGQPNARPEIWAYGLRNPWRFSFDRMTGDLFIADVGQNTYEEVDYQAAGSLGGANYGWSLTEGLHPYKGNPSPDLTPPIAEYSHAEGGCSVTGGYVYRGAQWPQWAGLYIFGDYCTGVIWVLGNTPGGWQRAVLLRSSLTISSFAEDQAGEIYVLDHQGGAIYELVAARPG